MSGLAGPFSSSNESSLKTIAPNRSVTVSDFGSVYQPQRSGNRSGNIVISLARGASYVVNNIISALSPAPLPDVPQTAQSTTGIPAGNTTPEDAEKSFYDDLLARLGLKREVAQDEADTAKSSNIVKWIAAVGFIVLLVVIFKKK